MRKLLLKLAVKIIKKYLCNEDCSSYSYLSKLGIEDVLYDTKCKEYRICIKK
jgi:hypothetical protein